MEKEGSQAETSIASLEKQGKVAEASISTLEKQGTQEVASLKKVKASIAALLSNTTTNIADMKASLSTLKG